MQIITNSFIFIDLKLIIQNPFFAKETRAKFYFIFTAVVLVLNIALCQVANKFLANEVTNFDELGT